MRIKNIFKKENAITGDEDTSSTNSPPIIGTFNPNDILGDFTGFNEEEKNAITLNGKALGATLGFVPSHIVPYLNSIHGQLVQKYQDGNFKQRTIEQIYQRIDELNKQLNDKKSERAQLEIKKKSLAEKQIEIEKKIAEVQPMPPSPKFYFTVGLLVSVSLFIWAFYYQNLKPTGLFGSNALIPILFPLVFFLIGYYMHEMFEQGKKLFGYGLALVALFVDAFIANATHQINCTFESPPVGHIMCCVLDPAFYLILFVGFLSYLSWGYFMGRTFSLWSEFQEGTILRTLEVDLEYIKSEILTVSQSIIGLESDIYTLEAAVLKRRNYITVLENSPYLLSKSHVYSGFSALLEGVNNGLMFLHGNNFSLVERLTQEVSQYVEEKINTLFP
jgi:tryptophan-rich sensory protein